MMTMKRATDGDKWYIAEALRRQGITPHPETGSVDAYVNHGRWVANCPCGGAEMIVEDHPMTCGSCGAVRAVVWPTIAADVETELEKRPHYQNRNWRPGETAAQLRSETEAHV